MSYTVKAGDTLFAIAQSHGITLQQLEAANPGVDAKNLQVGQVLKLPSSGKPSSGNGYVQYGGPASNFPNSSEWASWDELWKQNERLMKLHDSDSEVALIKKSIEQVAKESGVDRRVILCIIVQESGGNVRVRTVSTNLSRGCKPGGSNELRELTIMTIPDQQWSPQPGPHAVAQRRRVQPQRPRRQHPPDGP